jgi:hypothetical protein
MLNHLLTLDPEPLKQAADSFVPEKDAQPGELLNGKVATHEWLKSLGAEEEMSSDPAYDRALAAQAFGSVTGLLPDIPTADKKQHIMALRTPKSVQQVVGMLTAYEWSFVEHAQQIRSYIVAGLMDETKDKKPEVRLKAYKMLGEVTEVALFTQRTEVVHKDLSDDQIESEIEKRLERLTLNPDTPLVARVDDDVDDNP